MVCLQSPTLLFLRLCLVDQYQVDLPTAPQHQLYGEQLVQPMLGFLEQYMPLHI